MEHDVKAVTASHQEVEFHVERTSDNEVIFARGQAIEMERTLQS